MDLTTILAVTYPACVAIAALASAMALGKAVSSAMDATGRQPEASTKILINMVIGCAFIEALTIYALITILLIKVFIGL